MERNNVQIMFAILVVLSIRFKSVEAGLTQKRFEQSLQAMRKACLPKSGVDVAAVDGLRQGKFPDDNKNTKCYVLCIFEMSGVLSEKKEIVEQRARTQAQTMLPKDMIENAIKAMEQSAPFQKQFKDPCDRVYNVVKCTYGYNPSEFTFA